MGYTLAQTRKERIGIAAQAALRAFFAQSPEALVPSAEFLAEFLEPFLERELLEDRLTRNHQERQSLGVEDVDLNLQLSNILEECKRRST